MTWRTAAIVVGCALLACILVVVLVDKVVLPMLVDNKDEAVVPNLVGMTTADARRRVEGMGLVVKDVREQFSATVAPGRVLSQRPYAGAVVKEGRHVYLTASRGVETVRMPDVRGQTLRDARTTLMRLGLGVGDVSYVYTDSVPINHVLTQGTSVGSTVNYGHVTTLQISQGPRGSTVPTVVMMSLSEARAILLDEGFTVGAIRFQPSGLYQPNTVLAQHPIDTTAPPGSPVELTVSQ